MVMKNWYENSVKALQLNGKGERTQQSCTRAVRILTEFYDNPPISSARRNSRSISSTVRTSQMVTQYHAELLLRHPLLL